jgi:hypothetical protein
LIVHSTPIDPFFVVLLFRNETKQVNLVKVVRFGLDRTFFSKFYRIEEKVVMGNLTRTPLPVALGSFEEVAGKSVAALEWGIRLIENFPKDQWIISEMKEFESEYDLTRIAHHKGPYFSVEGEGKANSYKITTKDELKETVFEVTKTDERLEAEVNVEPVEKAREESECFIVKAGEEIRLDEKVTEVSIEVLEHLPVGKWEQAPLGPRIAVEGHTEGEVTMNELLPLVIEHYEGSVFSGKHYSCSLL